MLLCLILIFGARTGALCQEKRLLTEADLCGLASGKATLGVEYGISEHWSAGGLFEFGFAHFIKGASVLESEHMLEFGETRSYPTPSDIHKERIHFKYWPQERMKGPYAIAGITHGSTSGTDFCVGTGYLMHIWKPLNLYIEYSIGLKDAVDKGSFPVRGLSAGISLTFGLKK